MFGSQWITEARFRSEKEKLFFEVNRSTDFGQALNTGQAEYST
jgi:hypothetical protein